MTDFDRLYTRFNGDNPEALTERRVAKFDSVDNKKPLKETGEMPRADIEQGGEHYEWAQAIESAAVSIQDMTDGKLQFIDMRPFDVYQGPYATIKVNGRMDSLWSAPDEMGDLFFLEDKRWTGTVDELADAINGDKEAIENVSAKTKEFEGKVVTDKDTEQAQKKKLKEESESNKQYVDEE